MSRLSDYDVRLLYRGKCVYYPLRFPLLNYVFVIIFITVALQ